MKLRTFVQRNREYIDTVIRKNVPQQWPDDPITDDERELWVLNDEELYKAAGRAGVGSVAA